MSHYATRKAVLCAAVGMLWFCGVGVGAEEPAFRYDPKGRCDPFYPLVQEGKVVSCDTNMGGGGTGPSGPLQLGGILWDPAGGSIALINGTEAQRGDRVEGYEVTAIHKDAVMLTRDGQVLKLQIQYEQPEAHPPTDKRGGSKGGKRP